MSEAMQAIVLEKPFTLVRTEAPIPDLLPGMALVKIHAAAICGSDIHAFKGNSLLLTYPRILGHELCGTVADRRPGPIDSGLRIGDMVCVVPYFSCGVCYPCSLGRENCCTGLKVMGVHVDGGLCEYVVVPEECLIPVPGMDLSVAAVIEPLAVGAHAIRRGAITENDKVLVLGAGPIGLAAAEYATAIGADVVMADVSPDRRRFVETYFLYEVLDPNDAITTTARLEEWTGGVRPNRVIDSTGNKSSMSSAVEFLSQAGNLIFVGLQSGTVDISDPAIHVREATIMASRVAQRSDFINVIDRIADGSIEPAKMITHQARFAEAEKAIPEWIEQGPEVFKAVVTF